MTDREYVLSCSFDWSLLKNKSIFITGITGLVGKAVLSLLKEANTCFNLNLRIIGLIHKTALKKEEIEQVTGSIIKLPPIEGTIDYLIHCASETSSSSFINSPVEILSDSSFSIKSLLDFAKEKKVEKFVFVSTMEIYGNSGKGVKAKEDEVSGFNTELVRNSYPISKLYSESLCFSYSAEYGLPTNVVRLTQTFGKGIKESDQRVFAYFARCVRDEKDIVLKTDGSTERAYLHSMDAATSILTVLLKGNSGEVYNASNPQNYCSIKELANKFASVCKKTISVKFEIQDNTEYCNKLFVNPDIEKLNKLGWIPLTGLDEMVADSVNNFE